MRCLMIDAEGKAKGMIVKVERRTALRGLAALSIGICLPQNAMAHTSGVVELKCPVDGEAFQVRQTMSYTTFGGYSDFAKRGAIGSLYADMIAACPQCHFAGYSGDFQEPVSQATKQWVLQVQAKKWKGRSLSQAEECEAAADRFVFEKKGSEIVGNALLIASYLLRGTQGAENRQRRNYQHNAAIHFERALEQNEVAKEDRAAVRYLVGDLRRRTGQFRAAIRDYDAAAQLKDNPEWLVELNLSRSGI